MSPKRTLRSWGSSSSDRRRSTRPTGVDRSSSSGRGQLGGRADGAGRPVRVGVPVALARADHRAELQHHELAAVEADAGLAVEDRARRAELDQHGDRGQQRRDEDEQHERDEPVDRVLQRELPAVRVGRAEAQERDAAEVLDLDAPVDLLVEPRDGRDPHAQAPAAAHGRRELVRRRGGEADDDLLDAVLGDDRLEVRRAAQDGRRRRRRGPRRGTRSSSMKPTGRSPSSGWSTRRRAICRPTASAPMMSVASWPCPARWRRRMIARDHEPPGAEQRSWPRATAARPASRRRRRCPASTRAATTRIALVEVAATMRQNSSRGSVRRRTS